VGEKNDGDGFRELPAVKNWF
jgi:hypothetical protein